MTAKVDVEKELTRLKDFQRNTVEHAFQELFDNPNSSNRFLVADEVGLGKTLVARGLVAKALDHLWDKVDRLDVLYICSNADIARQNIKRLNLLSGQDDDAGFQRADRVTLLPITVQDLKQRKVNFISITPSTSIEVSGGMGTAKERALIYWLLEMACPGYFEKNPLIKFLAGAAKFSGFKELVEGFMKVRGYRIDRDLARDIVKVLKKQKALLKEINEQLPQFKYARKRSSIAVSARWKQSQLIGQLRSVIAKVCIKALEPDIIIMDEFQRFSHLFDGNSESANLAKELFSYSDDQNDVRILLLSATPYKMYSITEEKAEDDHYQDFVRTLSFLFDDDERSHRFEALLSEFRVAMFQHRPGQEEHLLELKATMEKELRHVMARTERVGETAANDGMLQEITTAGVGLSVPELLAYRDMQSLAKLLKQPNVMEYWKSSPYLLNFMDGYQFKKHFTDALDNPADHQAIAEILSDSPALLDTTAYYGFDEIEAGNSRLRLLLGDMVDSEAWRLLWLAPSLPYYPLEGPFKRPGVEKLTKRLIFSGWRVVPRMVSSLLSYEVERRITLEHDAQAINSDEARERRHRQYPLNLRVLEGRPATMPIVAITYPCVYLAEHFDPLTLAQGGQDLKALHRDVMHSLQPVIDELTSGAKLTQQPDFNWYWLAMLLLDNNTAVAEDFFNTEKLTWHWTGEEKKQDSLQAHIDHAAAFLRGEIDLGSPPKDLAEQLAWVAIAGPGVSAYRALTRNCMPMDSEQSWELQLSAVRVGWAVRNLFNTPLFAILVRDAEEEQGYWRNVLHYSAQGCLQAVLDEYCHVLCESGGLGGRSFTETLNGLTEGLVQALEFGATSLKVDGITVDSKKKRVSSDDFRPSVRFARPFSNSREDEGGDSSTMAKLRDAFNSPFWPFVLTSTSVGQEGLDFHWYCHAVVHWNLPLNPVDMEQREGRVHRYKGHAVRKNIAQDYGDEILSQHEGDIWDALFTQANEKKSPEHSDMVPYWLYPKEGGASIERHVPALPLSRDQKKLSDMRRTLAAYRLVFGQPRQEDMMEYLLNHYDEATLSEFVEQLRIDLRPAAI